MPFRQEPPRLGDRYEGDGRAAAAARRFAHSGVDLISEYDPADSATLLAEN